MGGIKYLSYSEQPIKAQLLMDLYKDAGWWEEREEEDIEKVLRSGISVGVWKNDRLIGFARVVTDGTFRAYMEDVMVHSSFQGEGIGQKLVSRLLQELTHIHIISLFCKEDLVPFYIQNEFKPSRKQIVMHRNN